MNREIKFRTWVDDKMQYPLTIGIAGVRKTMVPLIFCSDGNTAYKDYPLMQFTGLKDKNGKEIYEGDLLSFGRKQIYRVIYENACFYLFHENGVKEVDGSPYRWGPLFRTQELHLEVEVIGNIYENPELMEDSSNAV